MSRFINNVVVDGRFRVYEMYNDVGIVEKVFSMDAVNYYTRDYPTLLERIKTSLAQLNHIKDAVEEIVNSEKEDKSN